MFLNIVLDEAVEEKANGDKVQIGMVVIRGNSVVMLEVCLRSCYIYDFHTSSITFTRLLSSTRIKRCVLGNEQFTNGCSFRHSRESEEMTGGSRRGID